MHPSIQVMLWEDKNIWQSYVSMPCAMYLFCACCQVTLHSLHIAEIYMPYTELQARIRKSLAMKADQNKVLVWAELGRFSNYTKLQYILVWSVLKWPDV